MKRNKKGFTLLEILVVVLIIGILASIAIPQYQMAVTKSKVASILPLMRRWKDALAEYKLQHGSYDDLEDASNLGVSWPSDWKERGTNNPCGDSLSCGNDYWTEYTATELDGERLYGTGRVYCKHHVDDDNNFAIFMYQPDESWYEDVRDMITCEPTSAAEGEKVCKALGGKILNVAGAYGDYTYKLN